MTDTHLVVDENDQPIAFVDMDHIQAQATVLGFDLASYSDDPTEIERRTSELLEAVGPREFGYIAAAAMRHLVENVVAPLMDIADAHGHPVGERMVEAANHARLALGMS